MARYKTTMMATAKHTIYYQYRCEFCGRDTGWLSLEIIGKGSCTASASGGYDTKEDQKRIAQQMAIDDLNRQRSFAKKCAAKSRKPCLFVNSECPTCGKLQSWGIHDSGVTIFLWAFSLTVPGVFIGLAIQNKGFIPFFSALLGMCAGLAIGILRYKKKTRHITKNTPKNTITYNWN